MNDFWNSLAGMASGAGVMHDWRRHFGAGMDLIAPFLTPSAELARSHPCPSEPPCDCRHTVRETGSGLVAVCQCNPGECDCFPLNPADLLVYHLDRRRFGEAVRRALGFQPPENQAGATLWLYPIGLCGPLRAPALFTMASSGVLLRELDRLADCRGEPFLLLTPTGAACDAGVEARLRHQGGAHLSLSSALQPGPGGTFALARPLEPVLASWTERLAGARQHGKMLQGIHREIAAVRAEFGSLRQAKERLEGMLADGLFAFTRKVDPSSFKIFCTVLAEGDVAKASRALAMPDATLRHLLRQWQGKGAAYRTLLDLVRWRKKIGRHETLPLNEAILRPAADTTDYPGLLSDVLDGLLAMTPETWQEQCEALADLLRPVVR